MAKQIYVESGSGNITVTTSRAVIGTLANVEQANTANFANVANTANIANTALSIDAANVDGLGNVALLNLDGNAGNVLYGNGVFAEAGAAQLIGDGGNLSNINGANVVGAVANATFSTNAESANTANSATIAATVTDNAQPNITSVGTLIDLDVTGNVTSNRLIANTLEDVDYIDFDLANGAPSFKTGRLSWDSDRKTLQLGMNNAADLVQKIGEDQYIFVQAQSAIEKGRVVQFAGAVGDKILGMHANTSSAGFIPRFVIGVAPEAIAQGETGYVQTFGRIDGLQTNQFDAGDILYLQPNTAGILTNVAPTAPEPEIVLAAVIVKASAPGSTNGRIQVRPEFGYFMDQLHDVAIGATADDVLVYDGNVWQPSNTVPVANSALSVDVSNVTNIGNIATVNLDGNASNVLFGNGIFAELPAVEANRIFDGNSSVEVASTDGNVEVTVDGNLVATFSDEQLDVDGKVVTQKLTVDNGNVSAYKLFVDPDKIDIGVAVPPFFGALGVTNAAVKLDQYTVSDKLTAVEQDNAYVTAYVKNTGNNKAFSGFEFFNTFAPIGNTGTDPLSAGSYQMSVYSPTANLANPNTATSTNFIIGGSGGTFAMGVPGINRFGGPGAGQVPQGAFNISEYVRDDLNRSIAFEMVDRRGNGDAQARVNADDRIGEFRWSPQVLNPVNQLRTMSNNAGFSAFVDSGYQGDPGEFAGVGVEFRVVNAFDPGVGSNVALEEKFHRFYPNGEVELNGLTIGNVAGINLDDNASNVLYGNGVFAAAPTAGAADSIANGNSSVQFTGVDGDLNIVIDDIQTVEVVPNQVTVDGGVEAKKLNIDDQSGNTYQLLVDPNTVPTPGPLSSFLEAFAGNSSVVTSGPGTTTKSHVIDESGSIARYQELVFRKSNDDVAQMGQVNWAALGAIGNTGSDQLQNSIYEIVVASAKTDKSDANTTTTTSFQLADGVTVNTNAPMNTPVFRTFPYVPTNTNTVNLLSTQVRRGSDFANRAVVQANDRLGDITWQPATAGGAGQVVFAQPTAKIGAFVDSGYTGGNNEVAGLGIDITVIDDSATARTHQFQSNGDVSLDGNIFANNLGNISSINLSGNSSQVLTGDGTFSGVPASDRIENGNSSVDFTGLDGDVRFTVDGVTTTTVTGGGINLSGGESAEPGNIASLNIFNGSLQWTLDDISFMGGTPFGLTVISNNGFIEPLRYERARGNRFDPQNVESGDLLFNENVQARYQFDTEFDKKNALNRFISVDQIDDANNFISFQHVYGGYSDENGYNDRLNFQFKEVVVEGELKVDRNLEISSANDGFLKLSAYSSAQLANIGGTQGAMVSVSDDGGKPAYWDTANNRWSYVFDNSAV